MRNEFDGVDVNNVQREKVGPMQHEFEEVDAKEVQEEKVGPSIRNSKYLASATSRKTAPSTWAPQRGEVKGDRAERKLCPRKSQTIFQAVSS